MAQNGKESARTAEDLGSVPGLGRFPLKEGVATHSSILAWRIPIDRGAWQASPWGRKELDTTEQLSTAKHSVLEGCRDFVLTGKSGQVAWCIWPLLTLQGS